MASQGLPARLPAADRGGHPVSLLPRLSSGGNPDGPHEAEKRPGNPPPIRHGPQSAKGQESNRGTFPGGRAYQSRGCNRGLPGLVRRRPRVGPVRLRRYRPMWASLPKKRSDSANSGAIFQLYTSEDSLGGPGAPSGGGAGLRAGPAPSPPIYRHSLLPAALSEPPTRRARRRACPGGHASRKMCTTVI